VERIFEDKAGNIWFGGRTNEGVYRYDGKTVTNLKLTELYQNGPKPKAHNWAWPQMQDKNGNIWFSNWGGAYMYDGKTFTGFTAKDGLNNVSRIIEDRKGNIWFGCGDGLSRYDARLPALAGSEGNNEVGQGKSFINFSAKDGLTNPGVWSILEDKSGNIWVGTRGTGLYLYDASLPARAGSDGNAGAGQGKTFITYSEYRSNK
jgi:ligand-binding sensor domain-containing protein